MLQVVGTHGFAQKDPDEIIQPRPAADELLPSWVVPLHEKAIRLDPRGGMSYLMDWRLIHCLHNGLPLDIDVYDLAEWCAVGELSRISLENGSVPVAFPDFTRR